MSFKKEKAMAARSSVYIVETVFFSSSSMNLHEEEED
jgi:hypothetical protein